MWAPQVPYDEAIAIGDSWLNQALDCTATLGNWSCGVACERFPTVDRLVASVKNKETLALVARTSPRDCVVGG